ncbi:MAG: glycosyltransferase [Burkholderiales bacterium]|nr:glycosyltransferase [Burkholderiales bacterium]
MSAKCVVISAVNFTEGGPLTVLRECLASASQVLGSEWRIIALVHDGRLLDVPRVELIEVRDAKASWLSRLRHEWFGFRQRSLDWPVDLWFSLHDITPRVVARRQAVYCHNPSPFYRLPWREARLEPALWLFNRFYARLYGAFIRRNGWVVVQQQWIREEFRSRFGNLPLIVAHPGQASVAVAVSHGVPQLASEDVRPGFDSAARQVRTVFLYPALPRVFKNVETVLAAAEMLTEHAGVEFELRLTLDGHENAYARHLLARYGHLPTVKFMGRQDRVEMQKQYQEAHAVLFPSKLETWGLPITEAKAIARPLLVADLPYAHETVGNYDRVQFIGATDVTGWAGAMRALSKQTWVGAHARFDEPASPFARDWAELWSLLIKGL